VDTTRVAHDAHPDHDQDQPRPHVCYEGVVFIGHVIEEAGEGVEVIEDVNCKRCRGER
jgi:hypothetical protein